MFCFDGALAGCDTAHAITATARHTWTPSYGVSLHRIQLRIALRSMALVKVGSYMTYSTCSLHPVEDEAVVAAILQRCAGAVELCDASHLLPGLTRRPGLTSWSVFDTQSADSSRACTR